MDRRLVKFFGPLLSVWLLAVAALAVGHHGAIAQGDYLGPDDDLRLVQVRDLLDGQGWYDTDQHRMNVPGSAPMHWSRLVDLPLAATIALVEPLTGRAQAEIAAGVVVPALTLLVLMGAVFAATRRLGGPKLSVFALVAAVSWPSVHLQTLPMRIDHHGWQIALAGVMLVALLSARPWRSGLLAGAAGAVWASISLEALPYLVAVSAFLALVSFVIPREAQRLTGFLSGLAGAGIVLFVATKAPGSWGEAWCDAVMPAHLAAFVLAALGTAPLAVRRERTPMERFVILGIAAAASGAGFAAVAPQCLASPFATLDPLAQELWYLNVIEGRPLWVNAEPEHVFLLLPLVLAMVGCALGYRAAKDGSIEARRRWLLMGVMLVAAILIALFVRRAMGVAALYAIPGLAFLVRDLLMRAERNQAAIDKSAMSTAGGLVALFAAASSPILPGVLYHQVSALWAEPSEADTDVPAVGCTSKEGMAALAALPPARLLAPIDIAPAILAHTPHGVVASGHHRNAEAMTEVLSAFAGPVGEAHALIQRRGLGMLAYCPGFPETALYRERYPEGFYAQLDRGETPAWLVPLPVDGGPDAMRIFKVKDAAVDKAR